MRHLIFLNDPSWCLLIVIPIALAIGWNLMIKCSMGFLLISYSIVPGRWKLINRVRGTGRMNSISKAVNVLRMYAAIVVVGR